MLNIVCHRQSNHPKQQVFVEHAYKLRHVVLVCAHNVLVCVCFGFVGLVFLLLLFGCVWGFFCLFGFVCFGLFFFPPLGDEGKTLNEIVYFHD